MASAVTVASPYSVESAPVASAAQDVTAPCSTTASKDWIQEVLAKHNEVRAKHGAPPLTWSDDCWQQAKTQADACQAAQKLSTGNASGSSGKHGQNVFMGTPPRAATDVIESWYNGVSKYDFKGEHQKDTGNFTQVVWVVTQQVGMAKSDDGTYIVANYFPPGNYKGEFQANVLPSKDGTPCAVASAPVASAARDVTAPCSTTVSKDWIQEVLAKHNEVRAKHGASALTWSDECWQQAKTQADACQAAQKLSTGNASGSSGKHGQNVYMGSPPRAATAAIESWYNGVSKHDFKGDSQEGSGNFTQVVWVETKQVGMAKSDDGTYMVANYFPAGNLKGAFQANVLPSQ